MLDGDKSDLFYTVSSIWLSWAQFIVGVIVYTMSYYIFNSSAGTWDSTEFDSAVIAEAMVGILLLPIGLIGWYQPLSRFFTHIAFRFTGVLILCLSFIVVLFTVGAIYFVRWQTADWLSWDLTLSTAVRFVQGLYLTLTLWLVAVTLVCVLIRAFLQKSLFDDNQRLNTIVDNDEQPLLSESGQKDVRKVDQSSIDLNNNFFEFAGIFLFFFVFIPLFLWVNCVLMSDWHRMPPNTNNSKLADTTFDSWTKYYAFDCLYDTGSEIETIVCYARLYYDVQIYLEFIFIVSLFSYVVSKYRKARVYVRRRVLFPWGVNNVYNILPISMTIGEIVFWMLWLAMMITICYYFTVIHNFDNDTDKSALEVWARYSGILAIQCLSFAMFTVTRIRLWHDCFQVSFEHLIAYHRVFGYAFVCFGYLHGILWIAYFNNNDDGYEWSDNKPFASQPFSYHGSNWTIGMAYQYMIIFVPIFYLLFAFYIIRRKYFELFYYTHVFAAIVTLSFVLWHATQVWRFIIPPLVLYAVDRMIRLYNSSLLCNVEILDMVGDDEDDEKEMDGSSKVTRLSFTIADYNSNHKSAAYRNMPFKCGQYVFVSIGNISMYQWHPFTIASGEYASHVSLYVKNMDVGNDNAWSNLLHELAKSDVPLNDIKIQVDGPYGRAFDYRDYKRVVLVAGGIGITPCHSIFDTILSRAISGSVVPYVELIWVVRYVSQVSMFLNTWQKYEQNNGQNRFHVRIFVTRGLVEESSFQLVIPNTNIMYTQGRPPWRLTLGTLLSNGDITGNESLVFACGPVGLGKDVEQVAVGNGAHFYSESFEF